MLIFTERYLLLLKQLEKTIPAKGNFLSSLIKLFSFSPATAEHLSPTNHQVKRLVDNFLKDNLHLIWDNLENLSWNRERLHLSREEVKALCRRHRVYKFKMDNIFYLEASPFAGAVKNLQYDIEHKLGHPLTGSILKSLALPEKQIYLIVIFDLFRYLFYTRYSGEKARCSILVYAFWNYFFPYISLSLNKKNTPSLLPREKQFFLEYKNVIPFAGLPSVLHTLRGEQNEQQSTCMIDSWKKLMCRVLYDESSGQDELFTINPILGIVPEKAEKRFDYFLEKKMYPKEIMYFLHIVKYCYTTFNKDEKKREHPVTEGIKNNRYDKKLSALFALIDRIDSQGTLMHIMCRKVRHLGRDFYEHVTQTYLKECYEAEYELLFEHIRHFRDKWNCSGFTGEEKNNLKNLIFRFNDYGFLMTWLSLPSLGKAVDQGIDFPPGYICGRKEGRGSRRIKQTEPLPT